MTGEHPFEKEGADEYGDNYRLFVTDYGHIELELSDMGRPAAHAYTPEMARKLAKRLKKAADFAEAIR